VSNRTLSDHFSAASELFFIILFTAGKSPVTTSSGGTYWKVD